MQAAGCFLHCPEENNLGAYPRFLFEIRGILASGDPRPVAETAHKRMGRTKDPASYDVGKAAAVSLPFYQVYTGLLIQ